MPEWATWDFLRVTACVKVFERIFQSLVFSLGFFYFSSEITDQAMERLHPPA
jgi:hypothetical protein